MTDFKILEGSCIDVLRTLPEESIQTCITSPPYFGLRDYQLSTWEGGDPECDHKGEPMRTRSYVNQNCGTGNDVKNAANHQFFRGKCEKCGAVRVSPHIWGGLPDCEHDFNSQTKRSGGAYKPGSKKRWQHSADDFGRDDRFLDGHPHIPAGDLCSKCGAWCGDLGLEPTPWLYVRNMVDVFREVWRVLRPDGTLWLNLGDSYANDGKWGGSTGGKHANGVHGSNGNGRGKQFTGLKGKDLMGMPWRVAFALQEAGWYLRQDIIWHKPNPMPESVGDRCTKAHEYMFLLTKSPKYYFDAEAIKEAIASSSVERLQQDVDAQNGSTRANAGIKRDGRPMHAVGNGATRNKRSVWSIATQPYSEAHFATFPPKLIEPCVLAGTSARGGCTSCGKPWQRVTKPLPYTADKMPDGWDTGPGHHNAFHREGREKGEPAKGRDRTAENRNGEGDSTLDDEIPQTETLGWKPGCSCAGIAIIGKYPQMPPAKKRTPERMAEYDGQVKEWESRWHVLSQLYEAEKTAPQIVLDPFSGSGTTLMVSTMHQRASIGVELNPEYIEIAMRRLRTIQMELF